MKIIFGIQGKCLSDEEKEFFSKTKPAGFIIFARNIDNKAQVTELVAELKELSSENLILIDQEGGRVLRIKDTIYPSADYFGILADMFGIEKAKEAAYMSYSILAKEIAEMGINVNCCPVADLRFEGADDVIGNRSYSTDPDVVIEICKEVIRAHQDNGVEPVIKHMPGHGRAKSDSHKSLPVLENSLEELDKTDFVTFKALSDSCRFGMTAHIIIPEIHPTTPVTLSKEGVRVIRDDIGFKGDIFTDCLTMGALEAWPISERVSLALEAGCDYPIYSNGAMVDMLEIAKTVDPEFELVGDLDTASVGAVTDIFGE